MLHQTKVVSFGITKADTLNKEVNLNLYNVIREFYKVYVTVMLMTHERNNRLILDNVPYNENIKDFTNKLNEKPVGKSALDSDKNLTDIIPKENEFQG